MSLKIISMGKGIPERCVTNDELANFIDTNDEWIITRTGIKKRHICTYETMTDLCATASKQALENAKLSVQDIDLVICATIGGDFITPALSCSLSEQIGAKCPAFDINAACTGFIYALEVATGFFAMKKAQKILIVCAERMSTKMDWGDRNTCVLFGDGAAACIVAPGDALKYISIEADPDTAPLRIPATTGNSPFAAKKIESSFLDMQGQEVFKFAVGVAGKHVKKAFAEMNLAPEKVDWYLIHQANKRIVDSIRVKLNQPEEKFPLNVDKYGNISSVSVPLLLHEMLEEGVLKKGDTLFISAFGAGLTAGCAVMVWE